MAIEKQKKIFFFGVAIVSVLFALNEFLQPTDTRPSGRWSVLYAWAWDIWGSTGVVGFFLIQAAIFAAIAVSIRGK